MLLYFGLGFKILLQEILVCMMDHGVNFRNLRINEDTSIEKFKNLIYV